jgi:hypothetical protein
MNKMKKISACLVLAFLLLGTGRLGAHGRSLGLASAFTSASRGVAAVPWNPANLALPDKPSFSLAIASLSLNAVNNSFTATQYNLYTGEFLTDADKHEILSSVPEEGLRISLDTRATALGFSIGGIALTAGGVVSADGHFPKDVLDLILFGNEVNRTYDFSSTEGEGWAYLSVGATVSTRAMRNFSDHAAVGATVRYLRGLGCWQVIQSEGSLTTTQEAVEMSGNIVTRTAKGGHGYAMDLGFAVQLEGGWSLGLSALDISSSITWSQNPRQQVNYLLGDSITVRQIVEEDTVIVAEGYEREIDPFSISLPTRIQLGLSKRTGDLLLTFDYHQGLRDGPGASTTPRFAAGAEYLFFGFLPLRLGASAGGKETFTVAMGMGLSQGPIRLDLSLGTRERAFPFTGKSIAFAFSLGFSG